MKSQRRNGLTLLPLDSTATLVTDKRRGRRDGQCSFPRNRQGYVQHNLQIFISCSILTITIHLCRKIHACTLSD